MRLRGWIGPLLLALLALFAALPIAEAFGEFRGTDVFQNITGGSSWAGPLINRHPLSAYAIDLHVDTGATHPSGWIAANAQTILIQVPWTILSQIVVFIIQIFHFAFNVDLVNGQTGMLDVVGKSGQALYDQIDGNTWMTAAIIAAGIWGTWKILGQRNFSEGIPSLGMTVICVVVATAILYSPTMTIGWVAKQANDISRSIFGDDQTVDDHLFRTFVYNPWVAINFGGLSHCVGSDGPSGFPIPVAQDSPGRKVCRDHIHATNGVGGYAERFLGSPPGSPSRNEAYDAMNKGVDPQINTSGLYIPLPGGGRPPDPLAGWHVDKADSPAVDVQQEGGTWQRIAIAFLIFFLMFGGILLLSTVAVTLAVLQVSALFLLAVTPFMLIVAAVPGWGTRLFRSWGLALLAALTLKVVYTIVLKSVTTVSTALDAATATSNAPFLIAFGLQGGLFWALYKSRHRIADAVTGGRANHAFKDTIFTHSGYRRYRRGRNTFHRGAHVGGAVVATATGHGGGGHGGGGGSPGGGAGAAAGTGAGAAAGAATAAGAAAGSPGGGGGGGADNGNGNGGPALFSQGWEDADDNGTSKGGNGNGHANGHGHGGDNVPVEDWESDAAKKMGPTLVELRRQFMGGPSTPNGSGATGHGGPAPAGGWTPPGGWEEPPKPTAPGSEGWEPPGGWEDPPAPRS